MRSTVRIGRHLVNLAAIAAIWPEDGKCCVLLTGSGFILRADADYLELERVWRLWLGDDCDEEGW